MHKICVWSACPTFVCARVSAFMIHVCLRARMWMPLQSAKEWRQKPS